MDPTCLDRLSRLLAAPGPRRGVLGLMAAAPIVGGLHALLSPEETDAAGRRKRRKTRHKRRKTRNKRRQTRTKRRSGDRKESRKGKHKHKHPGCTAASCASGCCDGAVCQPGTDRDACGRKGGACVTCTGTDTCGGDGTAGVCGCTPATCEDRCGTIDDNCGGTLDCGACPGMPYNCHCADSVHITTCGPRGGGSDGNCFFSEFVAVCDPVCSGHAGVKSGTCNPGVACEL